MTPASKSIENRLLSNFIIKVGLMDDLRKVNTDNLRGKHFTVIFYQPPDCVRFGLSWISLFGIGKVS